MLSDRNAPKTLEGEGEGWDEIFER
jgi:hypothetical protein